VTPGGHRRIPLSELVPFMKKYDMPVPADIDDPHSHILILDDEPMMTRLIEKGFAKHKDRYVVQISNNPVDALVQVGKKLPDLLVMDLMMPVMDGFQVCQILKSSPATKDMKIVAISGRKITGAQSDFLAKNVDLFLQKPFEMSDLLEAVERLLV
jgi:two-component system, OmpR family, alkaline phosphatase synthesis response regulator PhoP